MLLFSSTIEAQDPNLKLNETFFLDQLDELEKELALLAFDKIATINHLSVTEEKVTVEMLSVYKSDDSLKYAWKKMDQIFIDSTGARLSEYLINKISFFLDLNPNQMIVRIKGRELSNTGIEIDYDNQVNVKENFQNTMSSGVIDIYFHEISFPKNWVVGSEFRERDIVKLRRKIGNYLYKKFQKKGTLLYTAQVDTSRSYYNSFTYKVSCINNEVIQSRYFEFLQIKITIEKLSEQFRIRYELDAKYAPYVRCPKFKEKFYKSILVNYPGKLEEYSDHLGKEIESFLKNTSK